MSNLVRKPVRGAGSGGSVSVEWGEVEGDINNQIDLQNVLNGKQALSEKGQPSGYAPTDSNNKVPSEFLRTEDLTKNDLLFYERLVPKENISLTLNGTDIVLQWVAEDIDIKYEIFYSTGVVDFSSPQATVFQPNYTISNSQLDINFTIYVKRIFNNINAAKTVFIPSQTGFANSSNILASDGLESDVGSVNVFWTE